MFTHNLDTRWCHCLVETNLTFRISKTNKWDFLNNGSHSRLEEASLFCLEEDHFSQYQCWPQSWSQFQMLTHWVFELDLFGPVGPVGPSAPSSWSHKQWFQTRPLRVTGRCSRSDWGSSTSLHCCSVTATISHSPSLVAMHQVSLHLLMRGCVEQLKLDDPWTWSSLVQSGPVWSRSSRPPTGQWSSLNWMPLMSVPSQLPLYLATTSFPHVTVLLFVSAVSVVWWVEGGWCKAVGTLESFKEL